MSRKMSLGTRRTNRLRLMGIIYSAAKEAELMGLVGQPSISQQKRQDPTERRRRTGTRWSSTPGQESRNQSKGPVWT